MTEISAEQKAALEALEAIDGILYSANVNDFGNIVKLRAFIEQARAAPSAGSKPVMLSEGDQTGHFFEFKRGQWIKSKDRGYVQHVAGGLAYTGGLTLEERQELDAIICAYVYDRKRPAPLPDKSGQSGVVTESKDVMVDICRIDDWGDPFIVRVNGKITTECLAKIEKLAAEYKDDWFEKGDGEYHCRAYFEERECDGPYVIYEGGWSVDVLSFTPPPQDEAAALAAQGSGEQINPQEHQ